MAGITLERVSKVHIDGTAALDGLSLTVDDGEFLVLVGPSGSGKSTALRVIAGLEKATSGTVRIGDRVVNDLSARDRDIAMVFQGRALYPHLSVRDHLGLGPRRDLPGAGIRRRVQAAARTLGLARPPYRRPAVLAGGQRQRTAMGPAVGRAIARRPSALLMDEPLSHLDARLRVRMHTEIAHLSRWMSVTTIYVTHDQAEAMALGHRIAVLRDGVLQQIDTPQELYDRPTNLFVAAFIGSPGMSIVPGRVVVDDNGLGVLIGGQRLAVPDAWLHRRPCLGPLLNRPVAVGIRPEALSDATRRRAADGGDVLHAVTELVETYGSDLLVHATLPVSAVLMADTSPRAEPATTPLTNTGIIARFNPGCATRPGERVRIHVDVNRLHLFDLETGRAVG